MYRALPTISPSSELRSVHMFIVSPWIPFFLNRPFVLGPHYSPIPEKLVTEIRSGQFDDMADLLGKNSKALEVVPQTYLDGKLWVSSSKKRIKDHRHCHLGGGIYSLHVHFLLCASF